ncbi:hypothetical protein HK101_001713 [Irineochytrium annulatum]|nr:hypothetical protein HK101_001713 [Irineochytrium annulatum]
MHLSTLLVAALLLPALTTSDPAQRLTAVPNPRHRKGPRGPRGGTRRSRSLQPTTDTTDQATETSDYDYFTPSPTITAILPFPHDPTPYRGGPSGNITFPPSHIPRPGDPSCLSSAGAPICPVTNASTPVKCCQAAEVALLKGEDVCVEVVEPDKWCGDDGWRNGKWCCMAYVVDEVAVAALAKETTAATTVMARSGAGWSWSAVGMGARALVAVAAAVLA